MRDDIKISVIIPIHNSESFLSRAIESVVNQGYSNYELILVDDRSSDSSYSICKKYSESNNNIIVLQNSEKSGGVSKARNMGIMEASGDLLLFLDSDDFFYNGLFKQIVTVSNDNIDMIFFGYNRLNKKNKVFFKKRYSNQEIINKKIGNYLNTLQLSYAWGIVYKLNIIKRCNLLFDETMTLAEDLVFAHYYLSNVSHDIYTLGFVGIAYTCASDNSLSTKYVSNIEDVYYKVYLANRSIEVFAPHKAELSLNQLITMASINNIFASSSPLSKREKRSFLRKLMRDDSIRQEILGMPVKTKATCLVKFAFRLKNIKIIEIAYSLMKKH